MTSVSYVHGFTNMRGKSTRHRSHIQHLFLQIPIVVSLLVGCARPYTGPWDMRELSKAPAFEWADKTGPVRSLYYAGEPYQGHPTRVFAYYGVPEGVKGKAPGIVLVHGGGGKAFKEWADMWAKRGYAAIAMDLAGCGPDEKRLPDGGPDQGHPQKFDDIAKGVKEAWPYHAVAAVVRAHSLLRAMPEVNPQRTGITGISWGGYLTCILAGLDPRFKVAVPVYGCGFLREDERWATMFKRLSDQDRQLWDDNFDPSRYLPSCTIPTLWLNGTNDLAFPPDIYQKSYRLVRGPRTLCVTAGMLHSHPHGWAPKEIGIFVDSILRGGKPLTRFEKIDRRGRQVAAMLQASVPLKQAALLTTTDTGDWKQRKWQSVPAKIEGNRITAELPTDKGIAWFLTATDDRNVTVSTEHEVIGQFGSTQPNRKGVAR